MDFLESTIERYGNLPAVTISHQSDTYVVLNMDDDPMKSIHVMTFKDVDQRVLYQIIPQGKRGHATFSRRDAHDSLWVSYLDMIGDLV